MALRLISIVTLVAVASACSDDSAGANEIASDASFVDADATTDLAVFDAESPDA